MLSTPIPAGYHTMTPCVTVQGAEKLIDFLKQVFAATEIERLAHADGTIQHAEVRIGDSVLMLSEARGEWKPRPAAFYVYVREVEVTYKQALAAGATALMEPANTFYGNRESGVEDQFGNYWWIATCIEAVSSEEIQRRAAAQMKVGS